MKITIHKNGELLQTVTTNADQLDIDIGTGQVSERKYFPDSDSDAHPQYPDINRNACDADMIKCLRAAQKRFLKEMSDDDFRPDWDALTAIVNTYRILDGILAGDS